MNSAEKYLEINKALWDAKTPHHVSSDFYDNASFMAGRTSLKDIELSLLGDVKGKEILHLQCHFGQDTLSLTRIGAKVTGVDISEASINKARDLNKELGLDAEFVCTDVYSSPALINKQFDIVFTTYGVLGWLPDMQQWAAVVSGFLKPGGKLILVEFHPAIWMFDSKFTEITYSYFNNGPIIETLEGTYANKEAKLQDQEIGWNHPLSEVMQNLINAGMRMDVFQEFDYAPYNCFSNTVEVGDSKYQFKGMEGMLPITYALSAVKA